MHEAYNRRAWPVYPAAQKEALKRYVARYENINFERQDLQEVALLECAELNKFHKLVEQWCDDWGKEVCNSVTKVVMTEFHVAGEPEADEPTLHARRFALLVRAFYSPKCSQWVKLEYLDVNHAIVTASELAYPFMLKIAVAHSKN